MATTTHSLANQGSSLMSHTEPGHRISGGVRPPLCPNRMALEVFGPGDFHSPLPLEHLAQTGQKGFPRALGHLRSHSLGGLSSQCSLP